MRTDLDFHPTILSWFQRSTQVRRTCWETPESVALAWPTERRTPATAAAASTEPARRGTKPCLLPGLSPIAIPSREVLPARGIRDQVTFPNTGPGERVPSATRVSSERDDLGRSHSLLASVRPRGKAVTSKRASWRRKESHEVGRWSNRGGRRRCRDRRCCAQEEEQGGGALDLDARDGCRYERRIRCSQRSERRRNPPLARNRIRPALTGRTQIGLGGDA